MKGSTQRIIVHVDWSKTPFVEIGPEWLEMHERGWQYEEKLANWVAAFWKMFPSDATGESARAELREILDDYWIEPTGEPPSY